MPLRTRYSARSVAAVVSSSAAACIASVSKVAVAIIPLAGLMILGALKMKNLELYGLVMLAAGVVAWGLELRPTLQVDASRLDAVPRTLAGWTAQDVPLDQTVERLLRADHNIQRVYTHPTGDVIWLYVGYYGTERGGRTEIIDQVPEGMLMAPGIPDDKKNDADESSMARHAAIPDLECSPEGHFHSKHVDRRKI